MDINEYPELLDTFVRRIFIIEDITRGDSQQGFLVRYRGRLIATDSAEAYDQLAGQVKQYGLVPVFREENGQQIILLSHLPPTPKSRPTRRSTLSCSSLPWSACSFQGD